VLHAEAPTNAMSIVDEGATHGMKRAEKEEPHVIGKDMEKEVHVMGGPVLAKAPKADKRAWVRYPLDT
jgi:hypothetical protein